MAISKTNKYPQPSETKLVDDFQVIPIIISIGALAVSLLTYRRNRKSEQIRIARDLTDRIETKRHHALVGG